MTFAQQLQYSNISVSDARKILCGKEIGGGCSRNVYECKLNDLYVVKIGFEVSPNVLEYSVWNSIQYAPAISKWFAESIFISNNGLVLVQRKVRIGERHEYPKKLPWYFTDHKIENYGFIGDQIKCVDYGNVYMMLTNMMKNKMKTVRWRKD